jgi:hypothetical protein
MIAGKTYVVGSVSGALTEIYRDLLPPIGARQRLATLVGAQIVLRTPAAFLPFAGCRKFDYASPLKVLLANFERYEFEVQTAYSSSFAFSFLPAPADAWTELPTELMQLGWQAAIWAASITERRGFSRLIIHAPRIDLEPEDMSKVQQWLEEAGTGPGIQDETFFGPNELGPRAASSVDTAWHHIMNRELPNQLMMGCEPLVSFLQGDYVNAPACIQRLRSRNNGINWPERIMTRG